MLNLSDESVHFGRRDCSTSAAEGVQLERYIQIFSTEGSTNESLKLGTILMLFVYYVN